MLKNVVLFLTVSYLTVFAVQCVSLQRANNGKHQLDTYLLLKIMKQNGDPCETEPCENGGMCLATPDDFKCICKPPYFGKTCNKDPCTPNPCQNEGKCKHEGEEFKCVCKSPFRGETCKLDPCYPNPCENDGSCELIGNSFNCTCKNPYHGNICELGPCAPNPCNNGGECEEDGGSFKCTCKSPFHGETCEQSPCKPNPCENNGKCHLKAEDDFVCECKESFTGESCEKGPCSPNPCQNGGNCTIFGNDTRCICRRAYFGEYCEKDLCSRLPCKNGGKCTIDGNNFKCQCKSPFIGEKCEKDLCSSNPCKNDGICKLDGISYRCKCKSPYKGKHCENGGSTESDVSMTTFNEIIVTRNFTYENITEITESYNWTSPESSVDTSEENSTSTDKNSTKGVMSTTLEQGKHNASPKGICETDSDCLNGGICRRVKENEHTCDCTENFGGLRCEVNLPCISLEQSCRIMNAACVIVDKHAICECPNGTLYHRKSGLCEDICDHRKCLHGKCEIIGKTYKCNCDQGYTGNHCDEKERGNHENFVPWFTVIASINLFVCVLLIGMFCVVCQIKSSISSSS